jgi:predicted unusual protein kinase regulating ubiquinone biosynthesis (AarF/ABC1/UbiB family)
MGISLKPRHLKRYTEIAWLCMKYGRGDLVKKAGLDGLLAKEEKRGSAERPGEGEPPPKALELAADLERMGPTFVKLGQLLSTRADLVPEAYIEALSRLQDKVEPFPFAEVEKIIAEDFQSKVSRVFSDFDPTPIAAASLGQVHRAALLDGRPVAVKVQRPGIREQILEDLETFAEVAEFLEGHTKSGRQLGARGIVSEFRKTLIRELDYEHEARSLTTLGENLKDFERIIVPRPVESYRTTRLLTMDYIHGNRILDAVATNEVKLKVDAFDETRLMEGIQKIANRITLGLVLAAMIVAAALLMRVETSFELLGYPGIAILLFLLAFAGGAVLVFNILFHDVRKKR